MKYLSLVTASLTLGLAACGGGGSSGSNTQSSSSVVSVASSQPSSAVASSLSSVPVEVSSSSVDVVVSSVAESSSSLAPASSEASSLPASAAASSVVVVVSSQASSVPASSEASVPSSVAPSSVSESSAAESSESSVAASTSSAASESSSLSESSVSSESSAVSESSVAVSSSVPASSVASETSSSAQSSSSATSLSWNIYNADYHPATNGSITLADGSVGEFTAGGLGDYFIDQFDGTVVLDTSAAGANTTTATFHNVVNAEGIYPKYFTLVAGVKGNADDLRVLELEVAMADDALTGSRLKAILRNDGSNKGVQLENANGGQSGNSVNSYSVSDMDKFAIYQVAITLTSATQGSVNVYRNGVLMPGLSLNNVTMRATSAVGENFVRFGEVSGSATYKSSIDWFVWTNQAAYSPAALEGLLPAGLGCVYGYGSADQLESCESAPTSSSSASSGGANSSSASSVDHGSADIRPAKMEGYAAYANVTGGAGGAVITVSTGTQLNAALCGIRNSNRSAPVIIMVDGTINHGNTTAQGCDTQGDVIEIKNTSNISIIGVGSNALFDEIGIHVRSASNIILQNLHIRNVKKSGSPTSNGGDAIGMETNVDRVWIDHNWLEASGGEKDGYDSLLDMKAGVTNVTVSYNLFNDSSRGGLIGSSDSDNKNGNITFHHNWYKNIEQRTPLIRHANVHMYNNYWSNEDRNKMIHGINSRMNAQALVEGNYFQNVNNPLIASKDSSLPGCWKTNNDNTLVDFIYTRTVENNQAHAIPAIVDGQMQSTCEVAVPYVADLDASINVPAIVMANAGVGIISTTTEPGSSSSSSSSSSASSEPSSSGSSSSAPATGSGVILSESFDVDKAVLFGAAYKALPNNTAAPMYLAKSGDNNLTVTNGAFNFGKGGSRLMIGASSAADTNTTTQPLGSFDLRQPYRISFLVVAAGATTSKFQIHIDNNTTGGSNSIHGSSSRIYNVDENKLPVGSRVVLEQTSGTGTANSHITLRTESSIDGITIDDFVIEYIEP